MAEKRAFHRSGIFYFLSAILLIVLVAGFFFWRNYKYKIVNKKLDNLTAKSKGLYQIRYEHLVIDEALGNISAENLVMLPDTEVYQTLIANKTAPESLFFIEIPKLSITGVKTPKALLNKEISAHIVRIENAKIEIRIGKGNGEKQTDFGIILASGQYRQLLGNLKSIHADSIILENASLTLMDLESKRIRYKGKGVSLRFAGTAIDSVEKNDSSRVFFSDNLNIHCDQSEIPLKNRVYHFEITGLDYNHAGGTLHTDLIRLKPGVSETAFAGSYKFAKDRLDISIGSLDIKHIDHGAILRQQIVADTVQIANASFRIFRDKSYPHDSVDRTHDYPQEAIMRLSIPLHIKKIQIKDSYIEYKEKNDKSDSSGKVAFFHVQAVLDNVTNMPELIKLNNQMRLNFKSSFLNKADFAATIRMRLNDRNGNFQLDAKLGGLPAVMLNPLLKPMALAELDRGNIRELRYHLDATNVKGKGKLILLYDGVKIKLLKKDEDKNKYKAKPLPTFAAGLLLKNSNPQNGKTRIGDVEYTRDIHRSIFNLMWKSLLTAIKEVAL